METIDLWAGYHYEELEVGQRFDLGRITISEAMVAMACALFGDHHPFHVDEVYAREHTAFGTRIAPGILTAGLLISPISRVMAKAAATHLEDHITYRGPVFLGETIDMDLLVTEMEPRTKFGIVKYRHTGTNQDGKVVIEVDTVMGHKYLNEEGSR